MKTPEEWKETHIKLRQIFNETDEATLVRAVREEMKEELIKQIESNSCSGGEVSDYSFVIPFELATYIIENLGK